jgi:hypothetical protein
MAARSKEHRQPRPPSAQRLFLAEPTTRAKPRDPTRCSTEACSRSDIRHRGLLEPGAPGERAGK